MKRIVDHSGFSTPEAYLDRLLKEWAPQSFDLNEKQQEKDLLVWLRRKLPDVPILAQYGIAKGKADIVIQDAHVIELKIGFDEADVSEFDRCIGQLERYRRKWVQQKRGHLYLVVVGESDTEFRELLHLWFKDANGAYVFESPYHLIEKRERK